jgi:hypothetical protein
MITNSILLPELYLPTRVNQHWHESGIDSFELCLDREHYLSFPHKVEYHYNSRGFRDCEWPNDLSQVIWCVGDSFTVGIGSPLEHTWPCILQQRTGRRTINVSLDGASNNWIARTAGAILSKFPTASMVVHWSFLHRRESDLELILERKFRNFYNNVRDTSWPQCGSLKDFDKLPNHIKLEITQDHPGWPMVVYGDDSLTHHTRSTDEQDIANTQQCMAQLADHVIHTSIPNWAPPGHELNFSNVIPTTQLDHARDKFHYDILTSTAVVNNVITAL